MLPAKKCQFFLYLNLIKLSLEIILSDFVEKEKPFLALKNRIFQSPKNLLFQKCHFFLCLDLIKITLEIMLSDFVKKKLFFDLKKRHFSKSKNSIFSGDNSCFWWKNASYLVYLDLVKIRLEIMLGDFAEKKETFLTIKNRIIQTQKNRIFPKA